MLRAGRTFPYALLLPAVLVMLAVVLFPLGYSFWLAFRNMSLYHFRNPEFVGLEQFRLILSEPVFYALFAKSVIWTVVNVSLHVGLGILLAMLLNGPVVGRGLFRTLLILPWAMPQYISALTWRGMFNYEYGAINLMLRQWLHLPAIPWLSDPFWAFVAPILTNVWLGFPFMMVVALGGLTSIPGEMYEAADLDGANGWEKFRLITLPSLMPVLVPAILLGTIWTFNSTLVIWLVSNGGQPADSTHILVTYIYKVAFTYSRYSYAAAFSVIVFLVLLAFVVYVMRRTSPPERPA
ncbi:MAG: sugar ABC transporter permease [Candidatus Eisenbacteria bacterium]|nr:sugar ABC transporter permease [Candidatus Eisenbacteria bacterium]